MSPGEGRQVRRDNLELRIVKGLLVLCAKFKVPLVALGPEHSWTWQTPQWKAGCAGQDVSERTLDQCCFGAPWRQRTRVVALNMKLPPGLARSCSNTGGRCEMTGKRHLRFQGKYRDGDWYTLRAALKPPGLIRDHAHELIHVCRQNNK